MADYIITGWCDDAACMHCCIYSVFCCSARISAAIIGKSDDDWAVPRRLCLMMMMMMMMMMMIERYEWAAYLQHRTVQYLLVIYRSTPRLKP